MQQQSTTVEIENIEEKRVLAGIDDVSLRLGIRELSVGDCVKLTFALGSVTETVVVRITSIRGYSFRGKLAKKPSARSLAKIPPNTIFQFDSAHIHSILRTHEPEED